MGSITEMILVISTLATVCQQLPLSVLTRHSFGEGQVGKAKTRVTSEDAGLFVKVAVSIL